MEPQDHHQDSEMGDAAPMQVEDNNNNNNNNNNGDYGDYGSNYDYDETPAFVSEGDAVEVAVDDDNAPMDDDDDDDVDVDDQQIGDDTQEPPPQDQEEPIVDMARLTIDSHTEPVYAVGCRLDAAHQTLGVLSGGGDDKAFWHDIPLSKLSHSSGAGSVSVDVQTTSLCLEGQYQYKDSISAVAGNSEFVAFDASKPPNPEWMAVGALDGSIVLYGPPTTNDSAAAAPRVQTLEGPTSDIEWLCWHPKGGNVVLAGSADATLWMYHTSLNRCLQVFVGHEASVTCGSFSADGKVALSASSDGTVRIWAPKTGKSKHVFRFGDQQHSGDEGGPPPALTCMATPGGGDQQLVMVGSEDGQAHICHIANKKYVASLRHYETAVPAVSQNAQEQDEDVVLPSGVEAVGFCKSNPHWCATGGMDGVLKIWDLANQGQCRHACHVAAKQSNRNGSSSSDQPTTTDGITKLAWHPTLPLVIVSTCSGKIQLWDARNGQLLQILTGHQDVINDMNTVFVPSPQPNGAGHALIVSASDDHTVRVFDLDIDAALAQAPQQIF